jgi:hypothetical protein
MRGNPWAPWLTRFRTPSRSAPEKLADYQHYMQQEEFKGTITDQFNLRKAGTKVTEHLKLRVQVVRELFAAEPQELRTRMKEEADAKHAALLEKHEDTLEGLPALDEEDIQE